MYDFKGGYFIMSTSVHYSLEIKWKAIDMKITMSMSRKGNCHDNAAMESFFSSLKTESFYSQGLKNLSSKMLIEIVSQYIDYYNKERIQAKLNYLSPVKYKKKVGEVVLYCSTQRVQFTISSQYFYIIGIKIITIIKI